ncbi:hypothetical protein [Pseudoxanthomonas mexicana]
MLLKIREDLGGEQSAVAATGQGQYLETRRIVRRHGGGLCCVFAR